MCTARCMPSSAMVVLEAAPAVVLAVVLEVVLVGVLAGVLSGALTEY